MIVADSISLVIAVLSLSVTGYLGVLALLAFRNRPPACSERPWLRFAVVVPAHNEREGIATTVESLFALRYPRELLEIVVVADNCDDDTAARARAAGARVLERSNDERRGKGYALELAFDTLLAEQQADAFVVVDADTIVSENLLTAFHARLERGETAVQAEYGVSNVNASWRTRLMTVALAMFHGVRSEARERLCVSVGLRGNGMCFSRALLRLHPHEAYGLVEDVEYGVTIGLGGHRVAYAGEATVRGEMVSSGRAAESQRRRWEGGRGKLLAEKAPLLLRAFLRERRLMLLDLAYDLIVPPLSYVGLLVLAGVSTELVLLAWRGGAAPSTWVWLVSLVGLSLYVGRGLWLSGLGPRGVLALLWAPAYVCWKLARVRPWRADRAWVRTRREREPGRAPGAGPETIHNNTVDQRVDTSVDSTVE